MKKIKQKSYVIAGLTALFILLNCAGKSLAGAANLPIWLDSVGTILASYIYGPFCGAVVGASVNIIYGFSTSVLYDVYALTSIAIGVITGICARKKMFEDMFGTLSAGFAVALASVIISTPLNCIFFEGYTGNIWGDGVIDFLLEQKFNRWICYCTGEFYVDFTDKVLLLCLLHACVKLQRKGFKKNGARIVGVLFAGMIAGFALSSPVTVLAQTSEDEENDYGSYTQTIYNNENGLSGGIATDIEQTGDGVLWIGTYNGLYRYNGSEFQWMSDLPSVKNVNCLYTDEEGRLWIGTNDNGLSIYIKGDVTNVLDTDDGMPSDSVRCIAGGNSGTYYVGTTDRLVLVTIKSGISITDSIEEITYAQSIAVSEDGLAAVVTDSGVLYLVRDDEVVARVRSADGVNYSCAAFDASGSLYVGTAEDRADIYDIEEDRAVLTGHVKCRNLNNLKELQVSEDGDIFVCADNGAGYICEESEYHEITTNKFNSSIDHMLMDYQGNLWFTSSRLGLLKMCRSAFTDIYEKCEIEENVVNCVVMWKDRLYFGTDSGLDAADSSYTREINNTLTNDLEGIRIRHMLVDSGNNLWIATSGKGAWKVAADGTTTVYDSSSGTLGDKIRMITELSDGTIVLAGDAGLSYIQDGTVTKTIGTRDGLENPKVLCMVQKEDGTILAGTDGNGIAVISGGKVQSFIKRSDGLSSDIILRICRDSDNTGYFIVTGSGLCYMEDDGKVCELDNFPHYNNFDIVQHGDKLFVLSSAGIYVVDKAELLAGEELNYILLDNEKGLQHSLTANAWTYCGDENILFLPENSGVTVFNMDTYDLSMRSYRMRLKSVTVDGTDFTAEQGKEITILSGAGKIEIAPEIINYSANDPYVSVYLDGVDREPQVMRQSEMTNVVYTNLSAGSYTLYLSVLDENGAVLSENKYRLYKEYEIYEHKWFSIYFIVIFAITVAYLVWLLFRTQIQRTLNIQKREIELAKKQIEMGNEAILTIAKTVDAKDIRTSQHSFRVSEYSVMIASQLGYDKQALEELRRTALLHDIGKIGIPDSILNKPARLTDEEYAVMKSHVVKGAEILKNFTSVSHIVEGALYHHERYDGKGYVHGLKGEEIPINARIIGIADAFDAMTSNRVYRGQLDIAFVIEELKKNRGAQFDPELTDIMLELIESGEIDVGQLYKDSVKTESVKAEMPAGGVQ